MSLVLLMLVGCVPETASEADPSGEILLADENNFWLEATVSISSVAVAERTDLTVDWSSVTSDLRCQAVEPALDVQALWLVRFPTLSEAEVEGRLSEGELYSSDIGVFFEVEALGRTSVMLSEFELFGLPYDVEEELTEEEGTLLLVAISESAGGLVTRSAVFLAPGAASEASSVELPAGCGVLEASADLRSLTPVDVLPDGPWLVSWEAATTDCRGAVNTLPGVDSVAIVRFDDWTLGELEADFLALEGSAAELWTADIDGAEADLSLLVDGSGEPFPGFSDDATWLLALRCSTCITAAPLFLTVLVP